MDDQSTSVSLIQRVKARDECAWRRLVRVYGPTVYSWCRKRGLSDHDAADVVQSVFLSVATAIGKFRRERLADTFRGWLWTITLNAIRDYTKLHEDFPDARGGTTGYIRIQEHPGESVSDTESSIVAQSLRGELTHLCRRALEQLRPQFESQVWTSFERTTIHGDRAADVARDLGISISSVYKSKTRVLKRLQRELADE